VSSLTTDHDEDGSITLLTIGLVTVVLMVLVGLVQVGHVFLAQREVADACDSAAVAGVQALDADAIYSDQGPRVDLAVARRDVAVSTEGSTLHATVTGLTPDGRGVLVSCSQAVRVPFGAVVGIRPVTLRAHSSARLP
jgi:Flp pilus assembly protein TadG